jgi:nitrate/nitrite transporter NarK
MNAGIGNLGVSVVQFLTPMVISGACSVPVFPVAALNF